MGDYLGAAEGMVGKVGVENGEDDGAIFED